VSRFLFVVPPLVGHINPAIGVAEELGRRQHEVAWAADADLLRTLLPPGADIWPCPAPDPPERPPGLRGFAALKFLWEQILVPLAETMTPAVTQAVSEFRPDALVVDQQAIAGALVAERLGLPWATSATTSSELVDPLAAMPKVKQWLAEMLDGVRQRAGDPRATTDLRFSPQLVLAFTTRAMVGSDAQVSGEVCFVGPMRRAVPGDAEVPASSGPIVFVSLGTVNADTGRRFLTACVDALRARPQLRAVVVAPDGGLDEGPGNVLVRPHVSQVAVLAQASAVVCHGGHNTVCEALSFGLPLVLAPIRDDQPIIADQVVRAGAGIRLRFDRADAGQIGDAIDAVLGQPAYAAGAARIQESFRAAGGAQEAADRLEKLAG
jgi:MGT family glycosyltransferase